VHGDVRDGRRTWEAVYSLVRDIPRGRVMTYGQIAGLLGHLLSPKAVGWAMHTCPEDVPWQRVVNASGACSTDRRGDLPPGLQRALLEGEGVEFRLDGTLDLARYRWEPPARHVRLRGRLKQPG
jgi:methylated-DNA-protein-cysteine methyltransferase-like protein